jgi:hypothetical protein
MFHPFRVLRFGGGRVPRATLRLPWAFSLYPFGVNANWYNQPASDDDIIRLHESVRPTNQRLQRYGFRWIGTCNEVSVVYANTPRLARSGLKKQEQSGCRFVGIGK